MKTNYLNLLLVFATIVLLLSCEKDEELIANSIDYKLEDIFEPVNSEDNDGKLPWGPVYGHYSISFDFFYVGSVNCWAQPESCLREVVVWGKDNNEKASLYSIFLNLYQNNKTASFFQEYDWKILFTKLTSLCATELANGNLAIVMKEEAGQKNSNICLIVPSNVREGDVSESTVIGAVKISKE